MKQVRKVNENEYKFDDTCDKVVAFNKEIVKLEKNAKAGACGGDSNKRKLPRGVYQKSNGKWRVRVYNPRLKICTYVGSNFRSYEEAVIALNKKKVELEKGGKDDYEKVKLPRGVRRNGYHRWRAQIWHPGLKRSVSLGCYSSPEEAEHVYKEVRAEFEKRYNARKSVTVGTSKGVIKKDRMVQFQERCGSKDKITQVGTSKKAECGSVGMGEGMKHEVHFVPRFSGKMEGPSDITSSSEFKEAANGKEIKDEVLLCALEMTEFRTRNIFIANQMMRTKESLLTQKTILECVDATNLKSIELDQRNKSRKRANAISESINAPNRPDSGLYHGLAGQDFDPETVKNIAPTDKLNCRSVNFSVKPSKKFVYDASTSVLNSGNSDCTGVMGMPSYKASCVPSNLQYELTQEPSASAIKSGNPNNSNVSDGSHQKAITDSYTDQALSMSFMNEFGQLLGQYSNLDEAMWFGVC